MGFGTAFVNGKIGGHVKNLTKRSLEMEDTMKHVFTMIEREGEEKSRWVRIGTGFINKDGSINVYLDALPVNGKINVRDPNKNSNNNN